MYVHNGYTQAEVKFPARSDEECLYNELVEIVQTDAGAGVKVFTDPEGNTKIIFRANLLHETHHRTLSRNVHLMLGGAYMCTEQMFIRCSCAPS